MPRYICKIANDECAWYLEWSTVVDAPVTFGMSLEEFKEYYKDEYGRQGIEDLDRRLERVEAKGISAFNYDSVDDLIGWNRAGKDESCLSKQQLIDVYCTQIIPEDDLPMGTVLEDE